MKSGRISYLLADELQQFFDTKEVAEISRVAQSTIRRFRDPHRTQNFSTLFRVAAAMGYRIHLTRHWYIGKREMYYGWIEYVGAEYYE